MQLAPLCEATLAVAPFAEGVGEPFHLDPSAHVVKQCTLLLNEIRDVIQGLTAAGASAVRTNAPIYVHLCVFTSWCIDCGREADN